MRLRTFALALSCAAMVPGLAVAQAEENDVTIHADSNDPGVISADGAFACTFSGNYAISIVVQYRLEGTQSWSSMPSVTDPTPLSIRKPQSGSWTGTIRGDCWLWP